MEEILPSQPRVDKNLERLARLMDDQFELLGFKFGINFIVDLVPEVGDIITTAIAMYIFFQALRYDIPKSTIARMMTNIGIYFLVGLVPWLGDLFGAWWKPNRRNVDLLRKALSAQSK